MPSHYPSETLRPLADSNVASNHSILTHYFPNLNIRHLATARASDSNYMLDYVARYKFPYVCMYSAGLRLWWPWCTQKNEAPNIQLGGLGSAVSSPSGVWGGATAKFEFGVL